jgi:hypothetical protein
LDGTSPPNTIWQWCISISFYCSHCIGPSTNEVGINREADANLHPLGSQGLVCQLLGHLTVETRLHYS